MRKPDRASFEHILRENRLEGQETLFVDDAVINVEGAEQAGPALAAALASSRRSIPRYALHLAGMAGAFARVSRTGRC